MTKSTTTIRPIILVIVTAIVASAPALAIGQNRPPMPNWLTDVDRCAWHWREGGGLGLWAQTCHLPSGQWQVSWDQLSNAFVTRREAEIVGIAVQSWGYEAAAGLSALSKQLVDEGQLMADAPCSWQPIALRPAPRTRAFYALTPTAPDALQANNQGEVPEPLCGPYGVSTHGVRYFITDLRWPDRAVFVEEGHERPLFAPESIVFILR